MKPKYKQSRKDAGHSIRPFNGYVFLLQECQVLLQGSLILFLVITACFVFSIAGYNHLEVAEYLLEHGADVNAQDKGGLIPLHNASSYGVRMLYYLGILLWGENAVLP